MTTTTDKIAYGTSTAIPCTISGLATSTTAGRQSDVVDNSSNLFDDALLTIVISTGASTPKNGAAAYVYLFGSEDGTLFDSDDAQPGASDAAYTVNAASNLRFGVIAMPTASKTYTKTFSVASFFGGLMPRKWGFVVVADIYSTGNTGATDGSSYTGITYTNS